MTAIILAIVAVLILVVLAGLVYRVHALAQQAMVRAVQADRLARCAHVRLDLRDDPPPPRPRHLHPVSTTGDAS
jgi:hypothetical protein